MLFWLCVIILAVGIGLIVVGNMSWDYDKQHFMWNNDMKFETTGIVTTFISAIILVVMICVLIGQHVTADAYLERNRETYNALTYKVESGACRDDFGLLSKEVIDEIQNWNRSIAYYQNIQDNFWVGIFYPNIYDEFEKIDYEKYSR